jgi:hypothetical protein
MRGKCFIRGQPGTNQTKVLFTGTGCGGRVFTVNEGESMQAEMPVATKESLREWLGVLVLSTGILRNHGAALPEHERQAQREIMHEAGEHLAEVLSKQG